MAGRPYHWNYDTEVLPDMIDSCRQTNMLMASDWELKVSSALPGCKVVHLYQ